MTALFEAMYDKFYEYLGTYRMYDFDFNIEYESKCKCIYVIPRFDQSSITGYK